MNTLKKVLSLSLALLMIISIIPIQTFAAIVLTAITGLFYSSSVLESVNSAKIFRLICVVSFLGLVCYHIVALLFRCIERINDKNKKMADFDNRDWIVTVLLILFIIGGVALQFVFPSDNNSSKNSSSINTSVVINDATAETSTNVEKTTPSPSSTTNSEENISSNN